ncbi:NUDIX hydrolase [Micromonospora sp. DT47]|uniref:NUDIX hydrolase n=1 Tax=Micromonospora sp. DT47 TaxID=3393431 RepID=UPI003CE8FD3C
MSTLTWAVAAVVTDDADRVLLCRQGGAPRRWGLPGGRLRVGESPTDAVTRRVATETGWDVDLVDLVGLYRLADTAPSPAPAGRAGPLPDVLVHVFRARARAARPARDSDGRCQLCWHDRSALPEALTPTTRVALTDALAGRSGVLAVCGTPAGPAPQQRAEPSPDHPAPR